MTGPRDDFAHVYSQYVSDVYGFFGYRVAARHEADDLTQLTFEHALRAWEDYDPRLASPRTWLLAIARNLLVDHYRRGATRPRTVPEAEASSAVEPGADPSESSRLGVSPGLENALSVLGDRDRELIALRFGGDMSGPEIAAMTGLTLANVQQILSRSLRRLRDELES